VKKVSVILVDWSVRESFHSIDSLIKQTVPRDQYELIWVEYYDHRPDQIIKHVEKGNVDRWIALGLEGMYNKHHMYNVGLIASTGDIIVISDSDALYTPRFIESIILTFENHKNPKIVLYLDEVRSTNGSFYPFKDYKWVDIMEAPGLSNWDPVKRMPKGLTTNDDIIHQRNYGACFCATKESIIESGGFDEHPSYHCFTCGPYELGWRLVNKGYKEIWHQSEWLLHPFHPWVRPNLDIIGETDGMGINLVALAVREIKRTEPHIENATIKQLRAGMSNVNRMVKNKKIFDNIDLPEVFEIEPTNFCNLRCKMCQARFSSNYSNVSIDISMFKNLASLKGRWSIIGADFEPAAHRQFAEIINILSEMGCKIDLTTNGTLLAPEVTDRISGCNIKNVTISFDGIRKNTYESIRKGAQFESTLEKILYFKSTLDKTSPFFAINYVMMRSNIDELLEAVKYWENHKFNQIRFMAMTLRSLVPDLITEDLYAIQKEVLFILEKAAKYVLNNDLNITLLSPFFHKSALKKTYPNNIINGIVKSNNKYSEDYFDPRRQYQLNNSPGSHVGCCSPFTFAKIMWNGDVQLCCRYIVGNLYKDDFLDIWYGEKANTVREEVLSNSNICATCQYFHLHLKSNEIDIDNEMGYYQQKLINETTVATLLEEGYKSYNCVQYEGSVYAIPQGEGAFEISRIRRKDYSSYFAGDSLEEVKTKIDQR